MAERLHAASELNTRETKRKEDSMTYTSRRSFMQSVLAAGSAPIFLSRCVAAGFLANRKINVGVIGYGRIAHTMDVPGVRSGGRGRGHEGRGRNLFRLASLECGPVRRSRLRT